MNLANDILERYAGRLITRRVICEPGLTARMPALLAAFLLAGRWLLVGDANTWVAQGESLAARLTSSQQPFDKLILRQAPSRSELVCETAAVDQVSSHLAAQPATGIIAVGSGTICDTIKLAAQAAGVLCAAVATAPSMNGYPSVIAAVLRDGIKRTDPTVPPVLVLADLDVLAAAPARMIAAGLADLLAKPVSTADWTLAHELLGDPLSADGLAVVEESARLADGIASALPRREPAAVARLFESLFVSGLAMAVAGASSPASGGEHLISHYLDITALAPPPYPRPLSLDGEGRGHDLHGLQVGVATLVTARLYERLLAWDPATLDVAARVRRQPAWETVQADIRAHFGPTLAPAIIAQTRLLHAEGDALADRLTRFKAIFPRLRQRLRQRLGSAASIERELLACGAATTFAQIGVNPARALAAVTRAHLVRARYTILHLLADLGVLDEWARDHQTFIAQAT